MAKGRTQTMLQENTTSHLSGFTQNPGTIFPPPLHSHIEHRDFTKTSDKLDKVYSLSQL